MVCQNAAKWHEAIATRGFVPGAIWSRKLTNLEKATSKPNEFSHWIYSSVEDLLSDEMALGVSKSELLCLEKLARQILRTESIEPNRELNFYGEFLFPQREWSSEDGQARIELGQRNEKWYWGIFSNSLHCACSIEGMAFPSKEEALFEAHQSLRRLLLKETISFTEALTQLFELDHWAMTLRQLSLF